MAQLFANNAFSSLASTITSVATSITLTAGHGARFPSPTGGDYFLATLVGLDVNGNENAWEIVRVTTRSSDVLTVVRGQEGTTASAWTSGTRLECRWTSGSAGNAIQMNDSRMATVNGQSLFSGANIPGGISYSRKTSAYTLVNLDGIIADTTSGPFTLTLPATPVVGNQVFISDGGNWSINNLTIDPNGGTIESFAADENLVCNLGGLELHLIYDGTKWNVHVQAGAQIGAELLVAGPASATDNAIARFDGVTGKLVQNSGAYIDDSGNFGLGDAPIATSAKSLDINGGAASSRVLLRASVATSATSTWTLNTTDTTIDFDSNAWGTRWRLGGTTQMTLDASGNVGVGTASPTLKFEVSNGTNTGYVHPGIGIGLSVGTKNNSSLTLATNSTDRVWLDSAGNLGVGSGGNTIYHQIVNYKAGANANYIQVANGASGLAAANGLRIGVNAAGNGEILMGASTVATLDASGNFDLSASEAYLNFYSSYSVGSNIRARVRTVGSGGGSGYGGDFRVSTKTPSNTWNTDALIVDSSGNLLVGVASGSRHTLAKNTGASNGLTEILSVQNAGTDNVVLFMNGTNVSASNAAGTAIRVGFSSTTSRSINAGGTINASGADYAEYEHNNGLTIAKGSIVGFKADGTLTLTHSEAVRFAVKSTDPSYVGGDVWGTEAQVGKRPEQPTFTAPAYTGPAAPGEEPTAPDDDADEATIEAYAQAHAEWNEAHAAHEEAMAEHAGAVAAAQAEFDDVELAAYNAELAAFEARLEAARQLVDRIAYSGKVPCNVTGATPGDYIVATAAADGSIAGVSVADPDFAQYRKAVGRVNRLLPDGRCEVAVIIH